MSNTVRRHALGAIAAIFLITWVVLALGSESGANKFLAGVAMRVGLVLGALWLALPQLIQLKDQLPLWLLGCLGLGGLIIAVRPNLAPLVVVVTLAICVLQFIGWLFKPPQRK